MSNPTTIVTYNVDHEQKVDMLVSTRTFVINRMYFPTFLLDLFPQAAHTHIYVEDINSSIH